MAPFIESIFCSGAISDKFELYLVVSILTIKNYAWTTPSKSAFCDEFSEQHEHQIIIKSSIAYAMPN